MSMLTRSLSFYTLGKPAPRSQLELLSSDGSGQASQPPPPMASMPRSISLQKLSYFSAAASPHSKAHGHGHGHGHTRSHTRVELLDESAAAASEDAASSPSPELGKIPADNAEANAAHTPPSPPTDGFAPSSTSPDGYLQTEAGSLPLPLRRPLVGNALVHPLLSTESESNGLPGALVEDFEIVGRADADSTCESWIVRSRCSGKMALFKPRDGENFEQRREWQEMQARREREERRRRIMASGARSSALRARGQSPPPPLLSSSCPHPLSLPAHLRTPLKRGILYGETTKKEVAAYLMDHDNFAGVPKTFEATVWLRREDAPNAALLKEAGVSSPPQPSPQRLLLRAASNSPPLGPSAEPQLQFAFDEEVCLNPAAAAMAENTDGQQQQPARSLFGSSAAESSSDNARARRGSRDEDHHADPNGAAPTSPLNCNLAPPPDLRSPLPQPAHSPSSPTSPPSFPLSSGSSSTPSRAPFPVSLPTSAGELVATYGSLQEFVENRGSAEEMGSSSFHADDVHRIGILDVRLLNLDRHLGNLLVQRDGLGRTRLRPIDHSFILPSYTDLADVHLEWTYWRQCAQPFSQETLRYVAALDPLADAALLRNLGIRDEALVSMVFSSMLLKQAAAEGLTLLDIARMVQRDSCSDEPSTLEKVVARVLGSQQQQLEAASNLEAEPLHAQDDPTAKDSNDSPDNCPPTPPLPPSLRLDSNGLPSVEEESAVCSPTSLQTPSTQSSVLSQRHRHSGSCGFEGPLHSPPMTPHTLPGALHLSASTAPFACGPTLLTRSNSEGAVALQEAIEGRQQSAPARAEEASKDDSQRRPSVAALRRPSVADAAAHVVALAVGEGASGGAGSRLNSPVLSAANSAHSSPAFGSHSPLPPPPSNLLRLGTELALHDPALRAAHAHANGESDAHAGSNPESGAGGIPSGAKLQLLLELTDTVIREEIAAYRQRNGLLPPTPSHAASATVQLDSSAGEAAAEAAAAPNDAQPAAASADCQCGAAATPQASNNTSLRSPPRSPASTARSLLAAAASATPADSIPPAVTAEASFILASAGGGESGLSASLRRSRSGSASLLGSLSVREPPYPASSAGGAPARSSSMDGNLALHLAQGAEQQLAVSRMHAVARSRLAQASPSPVPSAVSQPIPTQS